ncbi:pyrokinin-1 receptor-like [Contarinia nasturtii]|uniref:pyrokinin-1 receptor-like n=1 Tax=Contarinia nasturtii TaxID=265458 RepID=UPI0012D3F011|nr:pyrokinin-1 receptor-like [Contarinia nasturtii]XP_031633327.1 pyrokinin-1 receptor-like [Contarinia nasturtii]XP_031633328.1 pyrokinin-1 receptor-like [Contarinia nasturtii]XP_031633329.1 pyrokinin-1 receptor-like [Contarinia nasturtii]XP_031633331.1 pyrokinin-1 receptor-like [Contarinia nasturtii]XP_031633332.1 pyrokinin-1 receptor-like [Contarinia nasturtii]
MDMNNEFLNGKMAKLFTNDSFVDAKSDDYRLPQTTFDNNVDNLTLIYGPRRDSMAVVIPITAIYILIFVTGIIGNISTCIVIAKNRSMHTATNYYLFSLAISDFCLLLSGVPQEVYSIWYKYPYVFGDVFCVARGLIAETSANATVLTITSFTVERYLAICHPFLQHTMSKLSRAIRLILIVWVVSICLAIPQALQFGVVSDPFHMIHICTLKRVIIERSFELSTVLFFLTPMTLITILYILIGLKLKTSGIIKHENGGTSLHQRVHVNSTCRQQASVSTRRVLKMLVAVVLAFFICWAPFHAQRLVAFYYRDHPFIYAVMTYISGVLYYLSTCINPLLYNIMSNKFREAFKETLAKCFKLQKREYDSYSTYRMLSRRQRRWNCYQESGDYSGSSIRDDYLYSTSTQKQSFDSMTVSQCQSTKMSIDYDLNNQCAGDFNKTIILSKHQPRSNSNLGANGVGSRSSGGGGGGNNVCRMIDSTYNDNEMNVKHDKSHEIRISINCVNRIKPKSESKLIRFFHNISRWRLHSRHIGYYSPRTNHSIDMINVRQNPVVVTNNDAYQISERNLVRFNNANNNMKKTQHNDNDNDSISNSSLRDDNELAIKDELSAYMEELRLREIR